MTENNLHNRHTIHGPKRKIKRCGTLLLLLSGLLAGLPGCGSSGNGNNRNGSDTIPAYILPNPLPVDPAEAGRIAAACRAWYDSALKPRGFNGGFLVAVKGQVVFEQYNGMGHIPGNDTIQAHTSMQIASATKTFTAMAVLQLWQAGKLNIDDEFSKYFPAFNYPGVTIRTLLNHRSGLPNYTYFFENMGWDKTRTVTNADVLDYLVNRKAEFDNIAPPGVHFSYCNTNYALLALLIEKVTGKSYADYLQEVFFTPLQMKDTYVFRIRDSATALMSYDWRGRPIPFGFLDDVYGDKNIYTTVRDLLTWDRFLNSGLLFKPETLAAAYAPYSNEKRGIRNYGLGWRMNIYPDGRKIIYHNGWWHGSNSSFIRLLQDSATILVISNRFTRSVYHARVLANLFNANYASEEEDETENMSKQADSTSVKKAPRLKTSVKKAARLKTPLKKAPRSKRRK